jgi:small subunit ribosomal protein S4
MVKKPYIPGVHGPKSRTRLSDYARQLREKQKAKRYYLLAEKQFKNYFIEASNKEGNSSEIFWQYLEVRLDNALRRLHIGRSIAGARQMVSHGSVEVNGKKVNVPSYRLKVGDQVKVITKEKHEIAKQDMPNWLELKKDGNAFSVKAMPEMENFELPFNINLVIEFYSK